MRIVVTIADHQSLRSRNRVVELTKAGLLRPIGRHLAGSTVVPNVTVEGTVIALDLPNLWQVRQAPLAMTSIIHRLAFFYPEQPHDVSKTCGRPGDLPARQDLGLNPVGHVVLAALRTRFESGLDCRRTMASDR